MAEWPAELYTLRPLEQDDLPAVARWFRDIRDLASFDRNARIPLNAAAAAKAWDLDAAGAAQSGRCWFTIVAGDGAPAGITGLEEISPVNRDAVVALFLDKPARRKGLGLRCLGLMLDFGFRQLGLHRMTSYYREGNQGSARLTAEAGFVTEGRMRAAWFAEGRHHDMLVVGLLAQEWETRRSALAGRLPAATMVAFDGANGGDWCWPPGAPALSQD
ncbi:GNAT family N-acetyltransferase [Cribrihabitans pelagius]|uniref:GNAT family N-acetyltransferase n=1 Tax=Cribrihabitans pelagius TaxID=1765746 RepID=UPI003B5CF339